MCFPFACELSLFTRRIAKLVVWCVQVCVWCSATTVAETKTNELPMNWSKSFNSNAFSTTNNQISCKQQRFCPYATARILFFSFHHSGHIFCSTRSRRPLFVLDLLYVIIVYVILVQFEVLLPPKKPKGQHSYSFRSNCMSQRAVVYELLRYFIVKHWRSDIVFSSIFHTLV